MLNSTRTSTTAAFMATLLLLIAMPTAYAGNIGVQQVPGTATVAYSSAANQLTVTATGTIVISPGISVNSVAINQGVDLTQILPNAGPTPFDVPISATTGSTDGSVAAQVPISALTPVGTNPDGTQLYIYSLTYATTPPAGLDPTQPIVPVETNMDSDVYYTENTPNGPSGVMAGSVAPEINPGSMASALTLLIGGVLTLTGLRRRPSLALAPR